MAGFEAGPKILRAGKKEGLRQSKRGTEISTSVRRQAQSLCSGLNDSDAY